MPSTYTPSLRLEKQGIGENQNTWGQKLNSTIDMVEDAIAGHKVITVSTGTVVLTSVNNADDQSRSHILQFDGSLAGDVTIEVPEVSKSYVLWDNTTRNGFTLTLKAGASGGTYVVPEMTSGRGAFVTTDGSVWRGTYIGVASEPEVEAFDSTDRAITPGTLKGAAASKAETEAGTSDKKYVTPAGLSGAAASTGEMAAGTEDKKYVTPVRFAEAAASTGEMAAGTEDKKYVTPVRFAEAAATTGEMAAGTEDKKYATPANLRSLVASQGEVNNGTNDFKYVVPSTLESRLNTRLGASGNLGNAAQRDEGSGNGLDADKLDGLHGSRYLKKSEFDPETMTEVWSGPPASLVYVSNIPSFSSGLYVVKTDYGSGGSYHLVYAALNMKIGGAVYIISGSEFIFCNFINSYFKAFRENFTTVDILAIYKL